MIPIMIIILQFFHQYLFFSLAAQLSNWEAPACRASALSSSSESFWSLSKTLSTFTRIISTTSSTWACVCCSRRLLDVLGGPAGGPAGAPSGPGAPGALGAAASGADIFYAAVWSESQAAQTAGGGGGGGGHWREGLEYNHRNHKKSRRVLFFTQHSSYKCTAEKVTMVRLRETQGEGLGRVELILLLAMHLCWKWSAKCRNRRALLGPMIYCTVERKVKKSGTSKLKSIRAKCALCLVQSPKWLTVGVPS